MLTSKPVNISYEITPASEGHSGRITFQWDAPVGTEIKLTEIP